LVHRIVPVPRARVSSLLAALMLVVSVAASGCAESMGGAEGFVAGSGTVTVLDEAKRVPAPELSGRSLSGRPLALDDFAGSTVVLNVWGSWCAPCREEAPALIKAAKRLGNRDVQFLGVSVREPGVASAKAFVRNFGVPYPSIYDSDGSQLLGFRDTLPPDAIPSTLVIDSQGRVAARVLGPVDESTLVGLVNDVEGGA
jgi:thiol-disulfide isomerase/thioredoxin